MGVLENNVVKFVGGSGGGREIVNQEKPQA